MDVYVKQLYSQFTSEDELAVIYGSIKEKLRTKNINLITEHQEDNPVLLLITGGVEKAAISLISQRKDKSQKVLLLVHNGNNSLAAAMEISAFLIQRHIPVDIIQVEDPDLHSKLSINSSRKKLTGFRAGVLGKPSDWLIASSHSAEIVEQSWGLKLIDIDLSLVVQHYQKHLKESFNMKSYPAIEPTMLCQHKAFALYLALKTIIREYNLQGVTIRCFDLIRMIDTTACYALARLNAEGIPAGCESDIASITGMMWIKEQTGEIPWMANPASINLSQGEIVLAHCTAPLDQLNDIVLRTHFESATGVGIQGNLLYKDITLFRLGGENLNQIWTAKGKLIRNLHQDNLCRTQGIFKMDKDKLAELLYSPLGNHILVIPHTVDYQTLI